MLVCHIVVVAGNGQTMLMMSGGTGSRESMWMQRGRETRAQFQTVQSQMVAGEHETEAEVEGTRMRIRHS